MWNLEKQYRLAYLQSRNRDTEVQNKRIDTKNGKKDAKNWETGIEYTHY